MGQYFKAVILDADNKIKKWFHPHIYGDGLKIREHAYIGNDFCNAVEDYLHNNPQRLVWAGDYAKEDEYGLNLYDRCVDNLNEEVDGRIEPLPNNLAVINHTKKEYYLRDAVPPTKEGCWEWVYNPLPFLTYEGSNDRDNGKLIGAWRGDTIEVSETDKIPTGFKEIFPHIK